MVSGVGVKRALDLFCGAGGASMGLYRAGFEVVGVDIVDQPNYPFEFIRGDALDAELDAFDFVWASPPCQAYIQGGLVKNQSERPALIEPVRAKLTEWGGPFAIENVPGAPLRRDLILCGSMFGLKLRRHRIFECENFGGPVFLQPACQHDGPVVGVYGSPHGKRGAWPGMLPGSLATWSEAMGIDWMSVKELSQAIPPAYSEYIARAP